MREILFRGKHIHVLTENKHLDGRWIEGYLADENYINSPELEGEFLIDTETICQYTGLTDKNGRKIFEGDIVRNKGKWNENIGIVKFQNARFMINWRLRNRYSDKGISRRTDDMFPDDEVIGNIFDNPELIGGKEE